jgi:hypothetical protein
MIEIKHRDTGVVILRYEEQAVAGTLLGAQLAGRNLAGADLEDMNVESASLENANLAGALMRRAGLGLTRLTRASLRGADLQEASLVGADLKAADLEGADLTDADLIGSCLLGTVLRDARLEGADLACAYYDERTEWPAGYDPRAGGAILLGQPVDPGCADYWREQKYGPHMAIPGGSVAEPGEDGYRHRFGGNSWRVVDPHSVYGGPTLLLTLDLADPRLAALRMPGVGEIPLGSYLNCDAGDWPQWFRIEPETRTLSMVRRDRDSPEALPEECWFPNPMPETTLRLSPMGPADWPIDEESYSRIRDSFIGFPGRSAFIRVLGPPLWLEEAVPEVKCTCGTPMRYVCGIGSERGPATTGEPSAFVGGNGFVGVAARYFFLCQECRELMVMAEMLD